MGKGKGLQDTGICLKPVYVTAYLSPDSVCLCTLERELGWPDNNYSNYDLTTFLCQSVGSVLFPCHCGTLQHPEWKILFPFRGEETELS